MKDRGNGLPKNVHGLRQQTPKIPLQKSRSGLITKTSTLTAEIEVASQNLANAVDIMLQLQETEAFEQSPEDAAHSGSYFFGWWPEWKGTPASRARDAREDVQRCRDKLEALRKRKAETEILQRNSHVKRYLEEVRVSLARSQGAEFRVNSMRREQVMREAQDQLKDVRLRREMEQRPSKRSSPPEQFREPCRKKYEEEDCISVTSTLDGYKQEIDKKIAGRPSVARKKILRNLQREWHPDKCNHPMSQDVFYHIQNLWNER